jgi:NAD(P)H-hydrate epimerase
MARLLPDGNEPSNRAAIARKFKSRSEATLLFKGTRTIVTNRSSSLAYNTTGTPGMATGGQGDVLSGLLAALMARGFEPLEAAKTGSWLCGCASELALPRQSEESLSAITTIDYIGSAFKKLRSAPI